MCKYIVYLSAVLCLLVQNNLLADDTRSFRDLKREFRLLLSEKRGEEADVSKAVQLDRESREASRAGRRREAKRLLQEAILALKQAPVGKAANDMALVEKNTNSAQEVTKDTSSKVSRGFLYGLMLNPKDSRVLENMESYFQICKDLDAGFVKIAVFWDLVEPTDGQFKWKGDWPEPRKRPGGGQDRERRGKFDYDHVASLSQKYEISILPRFMASKRLDREADASRYAAFVCAFLKRYKTAMNIQYVEFQNEPNIGNDGSGGKHHWRSTAADLARVNNAAYDGIKSAYPDIMVGTAGFNTGSRKTINKYTLKFYEAYFKAKPKFDVFTLHDYPRSMNYTQGTRIGDFTSQYHLFKSYRQLLESYGYGDRPILITEGYEDKPLLEGDRPSWKWSQEEAATMLVESFLVTKAHADSANVVGKMISGVKRNPAETIGLVNRETGEKRKQYYVLKHLIQLLKRYPTYVKRVAGEINSEHYWICMFQNERGENMWTVFAPMQYETDDKLLPAIKHKTRKSGQKVELEVGDMDEIVVETIGAGGKLESVIHSVKDGKISFVLGQMPVFVHEKM